MINLSDMQIENELTKHTADFTEWYLVLSQYAKTKGKKSAIAEAWRDCYAEGLTPAEACNFVWSEVSIDVTLDTRLNAE
jgi:hypothetical protein